MAHDEAKRALLMSPPPPSNPSAYCAWPAVLLAVFLGLCVAAVLAGRLLLGQPVLLDAGMLHWLASIRTAPLNNLEQGFTFLGSTFWLAGISILVCGWLLLKGRPADAVLLVTAGLGSSAITNLVKVLVERPRPDLVPHLVSTSTWSFPSGHACSSAAVYMGLAAVLAADRLHRRIAMAAAALLAAAVAVSRVYLGVHYPTDALAGLALGWMWVTGVLVTRGALRPRWRSPDGSCA